MELVVFESRKEREGLSFKEILCVSPCFVAQLCFLVPKCFLGSEMTVYFHPIGTVLKLY